MWNKDFFRHITIEKIHQQQKSVMRNFKGKPFKQKERYQTEI